MFTDIFEERYKGLFDLHTDDDKVYIVQNGFDVLYSVEEKENSIIISKDFVYSDDDSLFKVYHTNRNQLLFMQAISKLVLKAPFVDNDIGMCPFAAETVGYIIEKDDWKALAEIIASFETAIKSSDTTLDIEFLQHNFGDEYYHFAAMKEEIYATLKNACDNSDNYTFDHISVPQSKHKVYNSDDPAFIDDHKIIIVGATNELLDTTGTTLTLPAEPVENSYHGFKYYFGNTKDNTVVVDIRLVNETLRIIDQVFYDGSTITYKMNNPLGGLLIQCGEVWAIIAPIRVDSDIKALEERETIRQMSMRLDKFIPVEKAKEVYLFETLDDTLFEKLCKDLLVAIGFKNVVLRGSTNAADGGVDIEADEERISLFGTTEIRHWIFQCKHTKAQFGRKDAAEIPCLMQEFKAECYGIFYSRVFTPQTLDRLKTLKFTVQFWGKNELETLLDKYRRVAIRYFGL